MLKNPQRTIACLYANFFKDDFVKQPNDMNEKDKVDYWA